MSHARILTIVHYQLVQIRAIIYFRRFFDAIIPLMPSSPLMWRPADRRFRANMTSLHSDRHVYDRNALHAFHGQIMDIW